MLDKILSVLQDLIPMAVAIIGIIMSYKQPGSKSHKLTTIVLIVAGLAGSGILTWARMRADSAHGTEVAKQHQDLEGLKGELQKTKDENAKDIKGVRTQLDQIIADSSSKDAQDAALRLRRQIEIPHLKLDLGQTVNPKYAFETRFILTNPNPLTTTNGNYLCEIPHAEAAGTLVLNQPVNLTYATGSPIEDLPSGKSRSLLCNFPIAEALMGSTDPLVVNIWISYTYENKQQREGFRFFAKHKEDGTFAWFPGGAAEEQKPIAKKP